jgi:6-phosphogluconolactonase
MTKSRTTIASAATAAAAIVLPMAAWGSAAIAQAQPATRHRDATGAVYVLSNRVDGNAVLAYRRAADGTLTRDGTYPTGGRGTGASLGSQGAVVLDRSGRHLYAVNAGSDNLTSFAVTDDGLRRLSTVPSGGDEPISVSVRGNRLYALNAGGAGNVSGFRVRRGRLAALPGSTRALSGSATAPAEVAIAPNGHEVVVTEKATSLVDVYRLNERGVAGSRASVPSSGSTPFGFSFTPSGRLAVSEAGPSAVSTYAVRPDGLRTLSASVGNMQVAACWVVVTDNGRFLYTGNGGGSDSISGYRIVDGTRVRLFDDAGATGTAPAGISDLALSSHSRYLYARVSDGTIGAYAVGRDGSLSPLPAGTGVPASAAGIAAR